ncbi:MAG: hypothetical protein M4D80_10255 [Myxococcota bacterium]|nr:hypothetical protein [Deltaproteobacteria bacterium]MDQ3335537.1 hypothetical protein [Myxococcota bacterium]
MKTWKPILGLCLAASTAAAQTPEPQPPPNPDPPPEQTAPPPPPPAKQPVFVETAPAPLAAPIDDYRPEGFSVGIGFGYVLPNSLETPNVTSARFRLGSGLTFEPVLRFQQSSVEVDIGMSAEDKETTVEIGALARYPLKRRTRVDFVLLGGAFVENVSTQPEGDNMDTATTRFEARYGMAVEFWVSQHWQISMSALNTVFRTERVSQEMGASTETVTTTSTFGAIYDPVISAMVHLYY